MGVEHSSGSQTLCYINADQQEECFRNEFEMHNVFEMGFDILMKDPAVMESIIAAKKAHGGSEVDGQAAAALESYMSQHHSGEPHDIEALQHHLTDAHILTEAHAPIHDVLSQTGLLTPLEDEYVHEERKPRHHRHRDYEGEIEAHPSDHYEHDEEIVKHVAPAHEVLAGRHHKHHEEEHHAIEADFASKLIDYKTKQSGQEFRLFGHTMASYEQLMTHVKHNQCVKITAEHQYHTESSTKWLCQKNLDEFWEGGCIHMDPHIELCEDKAMSLFLGKCVQADGFEVCPSEPVVVEHLKSEPEHVPRGCYKGAHEKIECVDEQDLLQAFHHGSCFKVDHKFICQEDMDHIMDTMCVDIEHYHVCHDSLHRLFQGEHVKMQDGHTLKADFPLSGHDKHSGLCRHHEGFDICLENIVDLYQQPHDCVMYADEWLCQDEMVHAWKEGCITVDSHNVCGKTAVEVVLQMCIDVEDDWICPTAVGTKHTGYHEDAEH